MERIGLAAEIPYLAKPFKAKVRPSKPPLRTGGRSGKHHWMAMKKKRKILMHLLTRGLGFEEDLWADEALEAIRERW
ncbi:hypothetical protein M408DRAFT_332256 [Serendipita vermifera MAFF 305830]|uniref:Uncharacterized protein n=1 Tax=Serendipita vermifera MAFF 305830 TaxID=933852 RepID=A0A0C2WB75_SERVB|nr:hypothetical protein M408DRAFT_332256 [Serendipita vermifera MAFF 305830]